MKSKKQTPIIRTTFPYLTDDEKEYLKNYEKELKKRNMTREDRVKEIFSDIGIEVDLKTMSFTEIK